MIPDMGNAIDRGIRMITAAGYGIDYDGDDEDECTLMSKSGSNHAFA